MRTPPRFGRLRRVGFVFLLGRGDRLETSTSHISTLETLREHVQGALELEHSTLPPYLCALFSIHAGSNLESVEIIKSVFIEEMLHLALAANVLNAIGGSPTLNEPGFVPNYPAALPHSDNSFVVPLAPFAPATIETFMRVERPGERHAKSEADNFETALEAIDEIEEQGEGLKHRQVWDGDRDMYHPEREEVAHYFRFSEIMQGRSYIRGDSPRSGPSGEAFVVDWTVVYPMRPNPKIDDYPRGSPVRSKMVEFNTKYCEMLATLHRAFNGATASLSLAISMMFQLQSLATELLAMPTGDGVTTAGPSFEFVTIEVNA